eukprot:gene13501-1256_t
MLRRKPTRLTLSDVDQEEFQEMSEKHAAQKDLEKVKAGLKVKVETPQAASAADMRAAERRARIGIGGGRK